MPQGMMHAGKNRFADFFKSVSARRIPTREDVLAEGFRESDVRYVLAQATQLAETHKAGDHGDARKLAAEYAARWQLRFDNDPSWHIAEPDAVPADAGPRELADRTQRR